MNLQRWFLFSILLIGQYLGSYELSIVSMFKNEGPYLKEWVDYHRLAGVDHFYLYNNFSNDNGLDILQPYIDEGVVEIIDWPPPDSNFEKNAFISNQVRAFRDGLKRSNGISKWVAFIDIDEFIVPKINTNIVDALNKNYLGADAIYVNWRNFGTSELTVPLGEPLIGKLIKSSMPSHSDNNIGKSIVRPGAVDFENIWYPHHFVLLPGNKYVNGDNQPIPTNGYDIYPDGKHYNSFLVIHHYCLRDEWFYQNVRLAKAKNGNGNIALLEEHYESFNMVSNFDAVNYLKKYHRSKYEAYWK